MSLLTSRRLVLVVLVLAQFIVMLDSSIVNVALPSMTTDLRLSAEGTAWVANAYFLTFGGFLLISGRAADLLGRRRMFAIGAALVTVASLLAGTAASEAMLLAARALQGLGAAILSPAALSILLITFAGPRKAVAVSVWGAASAVGGALGVSVGGLTTAAFGWQGVFLLTVPFSAGAVACSHLVLPRAGAAGTRRSFDAAGAAAVTCTALALVFAVLSIPDHGWQSPRFLGGLAVAMAAFVMFLIIERRAQDPIVPLALFGSPQLSVGALVGVLGGATRVCTFFLVALFLQQVQAYAPEQAGLAMLPTSAAGFLVSTLALPRVLGKLGAARTVTVGLVLLGAGLIWLSECPASGSYAVSILPGLMLAATGVAFSFMPSTMVITAAVPAERSGVASGMASASFQLGGALGIAVFTMIAAAFSGADDGTAVAVTSATGFHAAFLAAGLTALLTAGVAAVGLLRPSEASTPPLSSPAPVGAR
ncbi:MFS transporter [Cryobacterium tepidiphilum]|nr:MFS transporter [Cryobacterium tepidiphilum]